MNVRSSRALAALSLVCALTSGALAQTPPTGKPGTLARPWGGTDTTVYLPDSTILGRIEDRVIRAGEFTSAYYTSYPEFRPSSDSTGRASFLNTWINKEVMERVAQAAGTTLPFEDRLKMREHTQRVLSNVLYQRLVMDSIVVTEPEINRIYSQYSRDLHLREIRFDELAAAEKARTDLLAKRTTWEAVAKAQDIPKDAKGPDGDIGWITRVNFDPALGITVFDLKPGEISPVIPDPFGFHVFQALAARPARAPASELFRRSVGYQVHDAKAREGMDRLKRIVGQGAHMDFDTTNMRWAAAQFQEVRTLKQTSSGTNIEFDLSVPEFSALDTSRVLVRYTGGRISIANFMAYYLAIPPLTRPPVNSFDLLRNQLEGLVIEPLAARYAVERGLDKDPLAVFQVEQRRKQLMVDAMYRDSIESKVFVPVKERRAHYESHPNNYLTWPEVTYAAFAMPTQAGADSLAARLRAGEKPEAILLADSLAGIKRGAIHTRRKDFGGAYQKILFEELKPGQATVTRPDEAGDRAVLYLMHYEPERRLTFEEADVFVTESLMNQAAEKRLDAFLARHRKKFSIAMYPERLMKIRFDPPSAN